MKLTLAFCVIALAAGAQTFGVDSPALATLPAQPLADKCVSFGASTTLDTYEFNEQSNWSGATDVYEVSGPLLRESGLAFPNSY